MNIHKTDFDWLASGAYDQVGFLLGDVQIVMEGVGEKFDVKPVDVNGAEFLKQNICTRDGGRVRLYFSKPIAGMSILQTGTQAGARVCCYNSFKAMTDSAGHCQDYGYMTEGGPGGTNANSIVACDLFSGSFDDLQIYRK